MEGIFALDCRSCAWCYMISDSVSGEGEAECVGRKGDEWQNELPGVLLRMTPFCAFFKISGFLKMEILSMPDLTVNELSALLM